MAMLFRKPAVALTLINTSLAPAAPAGYTAQTQSIALGSAPAAAAAAAAAGDGSSSGGGGSSSSDEQEPVVQYPQPAAFSLSLPMTFHVGKERFTLSSTEQLCCDPTITGRDPKGAFTPAATNIVNALFHHLRQDEDSRFPAHTTFAASHSKGTKSSGGSRGSGGGGTAAGGGGSAEGCVLHVPYKNKRIVQAEVRAGHACGTLRAAAGRCCMHALPWACPLCPMLRPADSCRLPPLPPSSFSGRQSAAPA